MNLRGLHPTVDPLQLWIVGEKNREIPSPSVWLQTQNWDKRPRSRDSRMLFTSIPSWTHWSWSNGHPRLIHWSDPIILHPAFFLSSAILCPGGWPAGLCSMIDNWPCGWICWAGNRCCCLRFQWSNFFCRPGLVPVACCKEIRTVYSKD